MVWICFVLLTWFIFVSSGVAVRYFLAPGKAGDDFSPSTARPPVPQHHRPITRDFNNGPISIQIPFMREGLAQACLGK